jgi:DNA-binding NarL/FixJ family response regulator
MSCAAIVVDRCLISRSQLVSALAQMQLSISAFATVEEAAAALRHHAASLVLVSYEGEGFGLPLAMRLKGLCGEAANAIVVADRICPALTQASRDLGLLAVLQRPIRTGDLARAVERHVAGLMARCDTSARNGAVA